MKGTTGFLLMVMGVLLLFTTAAMGKIERFYFVVSDHTGVEVMGTPANRVEPNSTLNKGSTDVLPQKAAIRTGIPDQFLQREVSRDFRRDQLLFSPEIGSIAGSSPGPELLAYRKSVMPVRQGTNPTDDRVRFAAENAENAIIPAQYAVLERTAGEQCKRINAHTFFCR
jgi:hypothetical protein